MRFTRTTEQQDMAEALRALFDAGDGAAIARSWAAGDAAPWRRIWAQLGEMGLCGVAVPERFGGLGLGPVELVTCLEELGRAGLPGPCVESIAVVPALLADTAAAERWLPGIASGNAVGTVTFTEHVPRALDADAADAVFQCDGERATVAERPDAVAQHSIDPARRLWTIESAGEPVPGAQVAEAFELGALGCAAQLLGIGQRLLDMSTRYVQERHQFGRPVGRFQAVKHHLANVAVRLEFARPLVHGACLAEPRHRSRDISAAKIAASDAAYFAGRIALQVHGAIGYTAEHDLHLWSTKATALHAAWGTTTWHRRRVAAALAAGETAPVGA